MHPGLLSIKCNCIFHGFPQRSIASALKTYMDDQSNTSYFSFYLTGNIDYIQTFLLLLLSPFFFIKKKPSLVRTEEEVSSNISSTLYELIYVLGYVLYYR